MKWRSLDSHEKGTTGSGGRKGFTYSTTGSVAVGSSDWGGLPSGGGWLSGAVFMNGFEKSPGHLGALALDAGQEKPLTIQGQGVVILSRSLGKAKTAERVGASRLIDEVQQRAAQTVVAALRLLGGQESMASGELTGKHPEPSRDGLIQGSWPTAA